MARVSKAIQRMQQAAAGGSLIPPAAGTEEAAMARLGTPDGAMYGVMQPAYAQALVSAAQDDIRGPGMRMALRNNAELEARRYAQALEGMQSHQIKTIDREGYYKVLPHVLNREVGMGEQGRAGATSMTPDEYGLWRVETDPVLDMAQNGRVANESAAGVRKDNAAAAKDRYAAGMQSDPTVEAQRDTHPLQSTADPAYGVFSPNGMTPNDVIKQAEVANDYEVGMANARANMVSAQKPNASATSEPTITVVPGMYGLPPQTTIRGKASQMGDYLPSGNPLAPPPNNAAPTAKQAGSPALAARIAAGDRAGSRVEKQGNLVVITSKQGVTRKFNAAGQEVK